MKSKTKQMYKAVVKAKARLDGWQTDEFLVDVLRDALYGNPTRSRLALRKVLAAGDLYVNYWKYQFLLPKTKEALAAKPGTIRVLAYQDNDWNTPEIYADISIFRLKADPEYRKLMLESEFWGCLIEDLLGVHDG